MNAESLKASELRIGNWVSVPMCAAHWQIKSIGETSCSIDDYNNDITEEDNDIEYDEIYGIQITKEWLLKFGFDNEVWQSLELPDKKIGSKERLVINSGFVSLEQMAEQGLSNKQLLEAMSDIASSSKINLDNVSFPIKKNQVLLTHKLNYVHQLQNLYHSLTGEELTLC